MRQPTLNFQEANTMADDKQLFKKIKSDFPFYGHLNFDKCFENCRYP